MLPPLTAWGIEGTLFLRSPAGVCMQQKASWWVQLLDEKFLAKMIVPRPAQLFVTCSDGELGGPGDGNEVWANLAVVQRWKKSGAEDVCPVTGVNRGSKLMEGERNANGKERERRVTARVMFQVHRYVFIMIIVAVIGEERIFDERQKWHNVLFLLFQFQHRKCWDGNHQNRKSGMSRSCSKPPCSPGDTGRCWNGS